MVGSHGERGSGADLPAGGPGGRAPGGDRGGTPLQLNVLSYFASPDEAANLPRY